MSPEKRKGYAERWGGGAEYSGGFGRAQERREGGGGRQEPLEEGRRLRSTTGTEREEGRGEERAYGPLGGSSSSGSGMSSTTGTPARPTTSSTAGSEQRAEPVPVFKVHI